MKKDQFHSQFSVSLNRYSGYCNDMSINKSDLFYTRRICFARCITQSDTYTAYTGEIAGNGSVAIQ